MNTETRVVPVEAYEEMLTVPRTLLVTLRNFAHEIGPLFAKEYPNGPDYRAGVDRAVSATDAILFAPPTPSTQADARDVVMFCPGCFADEGGGSWAHNVYKTDSGAYCTNCGNGSCVALPKRAVESIRQQASWVGKRYYPHDEDRERYVERQALLALVTEFPGRSAVRLADDPDPPSWNVSQIMPDGRQVQTIVRAPDEATAIRWSGLTYYAAIDRAQESGNG